MFEVKTGWLARRPYPPHAGYGNSQNEAVAALEHVTKAFLDGLARYRERQEAARRAALAEYLAGSA